jgi:hypothetical protein
MSDRTAVNWLNPCARADALRDAYFRLISGTAEASIRYMSNGQEREVRYAVADKDQLANELREAERECLASQGLPPGRRIHTIRLHT